MRMWLCGTFSKIQDKHNKEISLRLRCCEPNTCCLFTSSTCKDTYACMLYNVCGPSHGLISLLP